MRLLLLGFLAALVVSLFVAGEGPSSLMNRISVFFRGPGFALDIFADRLPIARVYGSEGWYSR
jgi:hypothetical protein